MLLPILLSAALGLTSAHPSGEKAKRQGVACASLKAPELDGAEVARFTCQEKQAGQSRVCDCNTYVTHGSAGDNVRIQTYIPVSDWNGRFYGNGGGGMSAGSFDAALNGPASSGFATGSTDAGLGTSFDGAAWAGDEQKLKNFGHLSIHEMTVVGKALAEQMHGEQVKYSYWNGCSTGGRQGYMEAQRYPEDYQGIYAYSPAINWDRFHVAMLYPYLIQVANDEFPSACVWNAMTQAAIDECDENDGGKDGLIVNPSACKFDATTVAGKSLSCGRQSVAVTEKQAVMWNKITEGPLFEDGTKAYYGIAPGATFTGLATQQPFFLANSWTKNFVMGEQPTFQVASIDPDNLHEYITKSHEMFNDVIGTTNPDLSAFRDQGGKLLSWHGWGDQLIFANGTLDYRLKVEEQMGGLEAVDEFYRLYMVPAVQHCGGGGPAPSGNMMDMLIDWVENGKAPDTIPGAGGGNQRNLCRHPKELRYVSGPVAAADSWTCE